MPAMAVCATMHLTSAEAKASPVAATFDEFACDFTEGSVCCSGPLSDGYGGILWGGQSGANPSLL